MPRAFAVYGNVNGDAVKLCSRAVWVSDDRGIANRALGGRRGLHWRASHGEAPEPRPFRACSCDVSSEGSPTPGVADELKSAVRAGRGVPAALRRITGLAVREQARRGTGMWAVEQVRLCVLWKPPFSAATRKRPVRSPDAQVG